MSQDNLYLRDSYALACETTGLVTKLDTTLREVILQDNIFHPRGGGQPADIGRLNDNAVADVVARISDGQQTTVVVAHDENGLLAPGRCKISAAVDRDNRREVMALHSAGHLVNAAGKALGLSYRACNHRPGQASVEFSINHEVNSAAVAEEIEKFVIAAIQRDVEISILIDRVGWREIVIGDICRDSCGGTHVTRSGELSGFAIRSTRNKNGVFRLGYAATMQGA